MYPAHTASCIANKPKTARARENPVRCSCSVCANATPVMTVQNGGVGASSAGGLLDHKNGESPVFGGLPSGESSQTNPRQDLLRRGLLQQSIAGRLTV